MKDRLWGEKKDDIILKLQFLFPIEGFPFFFCLSVSSGIIYSATMFASCNTPFCLLIISINYYVEKVGSKIVTAFMVSGIF